MVGQLIRRGENTWCVRVFTVRIPAKSSTDSGAMRPRSPAQSVHRPSLPILSETVTFQELVSHEGEMRAGTPRAGTQRIA